MANAFVVFANGLDELGVFPNRAKIAALAMIMKDCCDYAVGATTAASIWARAVSCVSPARRLAIFYVADAAVRHERSESKARAKASASLDTLDTNEGTIEIALNPIVCACLVNAYVGVRHEDQASMQRLATSWIQRNVFGCEAKRALASFPHVIITTPSSVSLPSKRRAESSSIDVIVSPLRCNLNSRHAYLSLPLSVSAVAPMDVAKAGAGGGSRLALLLARIKSHSVSATPNTLHDLIVEQDTFSAAEQVAALMSGDLVHPATTDVSIKTLSMFDATAIRLLIDLQPFRCDGPDGCGLRFRTAMRLQTHQQEEHNHTIKSNPAFASRAFYPMSDAWIQDARVPALMHESMFDLLEKKTQQQAHAHAQTCDDAHVDYIPLQQSGTACCVCGEDFAAALVTLYDDSMSTWCATDATRHCTQHHVQFLHRVCAQAAGARENPSSMS